MINFKIMIILSILRLQSFLHDIQDDIFQVFDEFQKEV